jgi:RNA polymerase sigma-70 factor (ECF subfamily)
MDARAIAEIIRRRLPAVGPDVTAHLAEGLAAVSVRWPQAPAPGAAFAEHVADRLARDADPAAAATRLHIEDLFLAWWSGSGAPHGIEAFEATYSAELQRIAARFPAVAVDELHQQLRIKLFVGERPRIHEYSGLGMLISWLRVTAVRSFVDAARALRSTRYAEELDEGELLGLPHAGDRRAPRPELGAALKRAFADAVARLAPRQRTFLRHAYVDRLTLDQIAATYSIHRATVARTLASAREQLVEQTRAGLTDAIGVAPSELASVIGTLENRLELSLSRILRTPDPP